MTVMLTLTLIPGECSSCAGCQVGHSAHLTDRHRLLFFLLLLTRSTVNCFLDHIWVFLTLEILYYTLIVLYILLCTLIYCCAFLYLETLSMSSFLSFLHLSLLWGTPLLLPPSPRAQLASPPYYEGHCHCPPPPSPPPRAQVTAVHHHPSTPTTTGTDVNSLERCAASLLQGTETIMDTGYNVQYFILFEEGQGLGRTSYGGRGRSGRGDEGGQWLTVYSPSRLPQQALRASGKAFVAGSWPCCYSAPSSVLWA